MNWKEATNLNELLICPCCDSSLAEVRKRVKKCSNCTCIVSESEKRMRYTVPENIIKKQGIKPVDFSKYLRVDEISTIKS